MFFFMMSKSPAYVFSRAPAGDFNTHDNLFLHPSPFLPCSRNDDKSDMAELTLCKINHDLPVKELIYCSFDLYKPKT